MNLGKMNCQRTWLDLGRSGWRACLLFLGLVLAMGMGWTADVAGPAAARPEKARSFEVRGLVREIAKDRRKAVIRHEEIPGYMPKMTMSLNVRDPQELKGIQAGDWISFRLVASADEHWIENVRKTAPAPGAATGKPEPQVARKAIAPVLELKAGDEMPDFSFIAEDGQVRKFSEFRGKAVAFTFFFTRCPIPEFCPRMSKEFAQARELLRQPGAGATNWQLLCLSFDAAFDGPAVLAGYAGAYRGKEKAGWLFGAVDPAVLGTVGKRLDLMVTQEDGGFSHNLRTVVVDPAGKIYRQFDGNEWTARQLAEAIQQAAGK